MGGKKDHEGGGEVGEGRQEKFCVEHAIRRQRNRTHCGSFDGGGHKRHGL